MKDVQPINPRCLPAPTGNFTWVVQVGQTVYLSGQVGIDASGRVVAPDAENQARQLYMNMEATLKEMGGDLNNLVRTVIYVVGRENIAAHRRVRKELVDTGRMKKPASTLLLVAGLAEEDWLVEVDGVALLP